MRRFLVLLFAGSMLLTAGVACDDQADDTSKVDEDDQRLGPGDGNDETGPGR